MKSTYPLKRIGDVLTLEYGKPLPESERFDDGFIPAFGANGILCWTKTAFRSKPSIIVGRKGSAGEVNLTDGPFWPTDVTYFVEHDDQTTDLKYLFYVLKFLGLQKLAKGVKPGINRNDVYALSAPIPVLDEQKRIAAILDEASEGIAAAAVNAELNIAHARTLFRSFVVSSFTKETATQRRTVGELAAPERGSIRTGPFGSQLLHGEFVDNGVAVLGIDNVVENQFTWKRRRYITQEKYASLKRYTVKPGDVLISIMGTCGRCAVVPTDIETAINSKHLCCITLDHSKCIPEYLHAYFLFHAIAQKYLASRSKGAIMTGLNMGIIREMPVILPSVSAQRVIANRVAQAKAAAEAIYRVQARKLALLDELKQSILYRAFSNQLNSSKNLAA